MSRSHMQTWPKKCVSHDEDLDLDLECQAVEQALGVQLMKSVDNNYLDYLQNSNTDNIHQILPMMIDYLTKYYDQVTLEDMHNKKQYLITIHLTQILSST